MCQDPRVFNAMDFRNTLSISWEDRTEKSKEWDANPELQPKPIKEGDSTGDTIVKGTVAHWSCYSSVTHTLVQTHL